MGRSWRVCSSERESGGVVIRRTQRKKYRDVLGPQASVI